jgi:ribonuclease Z
VDACFPAPSRDVFARLRRAALFRDVTNVRERPVADAGILLDLPAFRLETRWLSHSVPTVGYRLVEPDGRRMLPDRLAALGVTGPDVGRLQRGGHLTAGGRRIAAEEVSEPRRGQRVAFIMDTRLCDAAFALADGADMVICESTYASTETGLAEQHGHLTARQAGRIAAECGARLLVLTHFSQRYDQHPRGTALLADEAAGEFGGAIVLARDLGRIPVPPRQ